MAGFRTASGGEAAGFGVEDVRLRGVPQIRVGRQNAHERREVALDDAPKGVEVHSISKPRCRPEGFAVNRFVHCASVRAAVASYL